MLRSAILTLALSSLALPSLATAQITDTGTGGCGATPAQSQVLGVPSLGNTVTFLPGNSCPPDADGVLRFLLFNADGSFVPGLNLGCSANPCGLLDPIFSWPGVGLPVFIPNDPGLIGYTLYFQSGCTQPTTIGPFFVCLGLDKITQVTVTP